VYTFKREQLGKPSLMYEERLANKQANKHVLPLVSRHAVALHMCGLPYTRTHTYTAHASLSA
ncbi:Hypothetical predicted protein, partial [Scomber scombrus]